MIRLLALLLAASAIPASAQQLDDTECSALWNTVAPLVSTLDLPEITPPAIHAADGWCLASGISFEEPPSPGMETSIETIRWRGKDLAVSAATRTYPASFEIELENFRSIPWSGMPALDYAFRAKHVRSGIDGRLLTTWDEASGEFHLERLDIRFPGGDGLLVAARAENIDLTSPDGLTMTAAQGTLHEVDIEIRNEQGELFEQLFLTSLATLLLTGNEPPETQVTTLKAEAHRIVDSLPPEAFPPDTRFALAELIDDMPNPNGTFTLSVAFEPGFDLTSAQKLGNIIATTGVPAIWRGAIVTARYDRKEIPH